ncbi:GNAT superfamily N-acetyltransferase [Sphingomonas zeicaulis]|uniref:GNAT family N-acetyltransferase n=1 Tax=Sphingomonas zeicaulis TaxID=1632740 RepID=UPI003D2194C6
MALISVPAGEVATVVTLLEMRKRPPLRPLPPSPLRLQPWRTPETDTYRALFRRVGAPWLWFSRLAMDDDRLRATIRDPGVSINAVLDPRGIEIGLIELDHRTPGECIIAFFALVPELAGKGHGRWMMAQALAFAWRPGVERVSLQTCTLDHPSALGFYRAQGFVAVERRLETFPDPRVTGLLPRDVAAHVPLLEGSGG